MKMSIKYFLKTSFCEIKKYTFARFFVEGKKLLVTC